MDFPKATADSRSVHSFAIAKKKQQQQQLVIKDSLLCPWGIVHQLRAENLGLWLTQGEQPKHVTY